VKVDPVARERTDELPHAKPSGWHIAARSDCGYTKRGAVGNRAGCVPRFRVTSKSSRGRVHVPKVPRIAAPAILTCHGAARVGRQPFAAWRCGCVQRPQVLSRRPEAESRVGRRGRLAKTKARILVQPALFNRNSRSTWTNLSPS